MVCNSPFLEVALRRNTGAQKHLDATLDDLKKSLKASMNSLHRRQITERRQLHRLQAEKELLNTDATSSGLDSGLKVHSVSAYTLRDLSLSQQPSRPPSVTLDEFDRRLRAWCSERTSADRLFCCVHIDPRTEMRCFVPNVETASLFNRFNINIRQ